MMSVKKAYVKVKPKSAKSILGRPYIVGTILGAAVCAMVLSFVLKPYQMEEEIKNVEQTENSENFESAQVLEHQEIYVEEKTEENEPVEEKNEEKEEIEESALFEKSLKGNFFMPVEGEIFNGFSGTKPVKSNTMGDWRVHSGIDIKAAAGTSVKAPQSGKIIKAYSDKLTGNTVSIDHGNGVISTIYNLDKMNVSEGQNVNSGDIIGTVGQSATLEMADDPHVHFEIKENGKYVNPNEFLK